MKNSLQLKKRDNQNKKKMKQAKNNRGKQQRINKDNHKYVQQFAYQQRRYNNSQDLQKLFEPQRITHKSNKIGQKIQTINNQICLNGHSLIQTNPLVVKISQDYQNDTASLSFTKNKPQKKYHIQHQQDKKQNKINDPYDGDANNDDDNSNDGNSNDDNNNHDGIIQGVNNNQIQKLKVSLENKSLKKIQNIVDSKIIFQEKKKQNNQDENIKKFQDTNYLKCKQPISQSKSEQQIKNQTRNKQENIVQTLQVQRSLYIEKQGNNSIKEIEQAEYPNQKDQKVSNFLKKLSYNQESKFKMESISPIQQSFQQFLYTDEDSLIELYLKQIPSSNASSVKQQKQNINYDQKNNQSQNQQLKQKEINDLFKKDTQQFEQNSFNKLLNIRAQDQNQKQIQSLILQNVQQNYQDNNIKEQRQQQQILNLSTLSLNQNLNVCQQNEQNQFNEKQFICQIDQKFKIRDAYIPAQIQEQQIQRIRISIIMAKEHMMKFIKPRKLKYMQYIDSGYEHLYGEQFMVMIYNQYQKLNGRLSKDQLKVKLINDILFLARKTRIKFNMA